jgi:OmpA-OmpF porin, OOP family
LRPAPSKPGHPAGASAQLIQHRNQIMQRHSLVAFGVPCALLSILTCSAPAAVAGEPSPSASWYSGIAGGSADFSLPKSPLPVAGKDNHGLMGKVYGGAHISEHLGAELGYARLGSFTQRSIYNGTEIKQNGTGQSIYAAFTGRLPVGEAFAFNGRLGVSFGKFHENGTRLAGTPILEGRKTSMLAGAGVEYRVTRRVAFTADYDYYGKVSKTVKVDAAMVGIRLSF